MDGYCHSSQVVGMWMGVGIKSGRGWGPGCGVGGNRSIEGGVVF